MLHGIKSWFINEIHRVCIHHLQRVIHSGFICLCLLSFINSLFPILNFPLLLFCPCKCESKGDSKHSCLTPVVISNRSVSIISSYHALAKFYIVIWCLVDVLLSHIPPKTTVYFCQLFKDVYWSMKAVLSWPSLSIHFSFSCRKLNRAPMSLVYFLNQSWILHICGWTMDIILHSKAFAHTLPKWLSKVISLYVSLSLVLPFFFLIGTIINFYHSMLVVLYLILQ